MLHALSQKTSLLTMECYREEYNLPHNLNKVHNNVHHARDIELHSNSQI